MTKAYSNKALPAGTVLREWRLEEVLGVGGFGIVYKARGIYFNELVAIKEYFPSSISERDEEATVVPIDSDAEEVHALGLKKFVEEAKLLWNLSTPTRHPNIVSVRSLFEIHGTAYMVMDFEDGMSLSRLLKDGYRFNERSLWEIISPIAEGLDRAHRVGVLHRDIKPPNILVTPEGRSVLIDFGSARFDTAEATSTQVTFHTPPYAAIEQYVKTYQQGPWTDIYALGVVLFECVTGAKPPEVLERLHGGQGEPLASGHWPGYSKGFLAAIDEAMTIKPDERPQSIADWLALFPRAGAAKDHQAEDDDRTHFTINEVAVKEIMPVAPRADDAEVPIQSKVPDSPERANFKRAGRDTSAATKLAEAPAAAPPETTPQVAPAAEQITKAPPGTNKPAAAAGSSKKNLLVAGAAGAVLIVGAAAWSLTRGPAVSAPADEAAIVTDLPPATTAGYSGPDTALLAPAFKTLADEARAAGIPDEAVTDLALTSDKLAADQARLQSLLGNPQQGPAAAALQASMQQLAMASDKKFAAAVTNHGAMRRQRLAGAAPWTDPATGRAQPGSSTERRYVETLNARSGELAEAAAAVDAAPDAAQSAAAARDVLAKYRTLLGVMAAVPATSTLAKTVDQPKTNTMSATASKPAITPRPAQTAAPTASTQASASTSQPLSGAKVSELNAIIDEARGMARDVMRSDRGENGRLARGYDDYLKGLKNSARGVSTNAQADAMIAQAKQTRAYLVFLRKQTR